jgi:branched-chain amino acid transport system permease protein
MHSLVTLVAFGGVSLDDLQPYIPIGLALGGVYAFSGLGIVVLYRTTGVINLAFGAIGAAGGLISWYLIEHHDWPQWPAYLVCIAFGGVVTLLYGVLFGPAFAARDPLVKMMGTLGLALILLGLMAWRAPPIAASVRILHLPSSDWQYRVGDATVTGTQTIALVLAVLLTVGTGIFLRVTRMGTAMRGLANDREITATLGVPVRRVEAFAWLGSGLICGTAGLVLADQLGTLDYAGLSFPLVIAALAAALIGRLHSLPGTLIGGLAIGLIQGCLTAYFAWPTSELPVSQYRAVTPFVLAILALLWFARRRVVVASRTAR